MYRAPESVALGSGRKSRCNHEPSARPMATAQDSGSDAALSARSDVDQREAFLACRMGEPLIDRDDLQRCGPPLRGCEGGGQLQGIGRSQRMNAEKSHRALADDIAGLDLVPTAREPVQSVEGGYDPFRVKRG